MAILLMNPIEVLIQDVPTVLFAEFCRFHFPLIKFFVGA